MPQFIVTANKLNRRKAVPASLPDPNNIIDFVPKNFIFEAEEVADHEMPPTVHDKWYKDNNGFFYWGGGINELRGTAAVADRPIVTPGLEISGQTDYKTLLTNIPPQWLATNGRGIKVAILDTGFFIDHQDLVHLKSTAVLKDFGGNNNTTDNRGHGTHLLGMLGAKTTASNGIMGLIPEAKFFLYKTIQEDVGFFHSFVEKAIEDAISEGVDIINMSFSVPSMEGSALDTVIKKALDESIILVAAASENDRLIQPSLVFPAQFQKVVSVGEITAEFAQSIQASFNDQLDFIMPFVNQRSCWINDALGLYNNLKGSSQATALVTAALTLSMSFKNKSGNPIDDLKGIVASFSAAVFNDGTLKIIKP